MAFIRLIIGFLVLASIACATTVAVKEKETESAAFPDLQETWSVVPPDVQDRWSGLLHRNMKITSGESPEYNRAFGSVLKNCPDKAELPWNYARSQLSDFFHMRDITYRYITDAMDSGKEWKEEEAVLFRVAQHMLEEHLVFWREADFCGVAS